MRRKKHWVGGQIRSGTLGKLYLPQIFLRHNDYIIPCGSAADFGGFFFRAGFGFGFLVPVGFPALFWP